MIKSILNVLLTLFLSLLGLLCSTQNAFSQQPPPPPPPPPLTQFVFSCSYQLNEVNFLPPLNAPPDAYITIKKDPTATEPNPIDYTNPAWMQDNPNNSNPIGYVSGYAPRLNALFTITCNSNQTYYVKGEGSNGFNFTAQALLPENGKYRYPDISANKIFTANTVNFFQNFTIKWQIATSQNGPWETVQTSKNPMYVTFAKPNLGLLNNQPLLGINTIAFNTTLYLSCKNAAGLNNEQAIVDAIYQEFTDKDVRKIGGTQPMYYWKQSNSNFCNTVEKLLLNEDGTCGTWARFFIDMLRLQGINDADIIKSGIAAFNTLGNSGTGILPDALKTQLNQDATSFFAPNTLFKEVPAQPYNAYFFIPNWNMELNKFYACNDDLSPKMETETTTIGNITYTGADVIGIRGQGPTTHDNPKSNFLDHSIVKYKTTYYDPSYGTPPYTTANDWENNSVFGFGTIVEVNFKIIGSNELLTKKFLWYGAKNDTTLQQCIIP